MLHAYKGGYIYVKIKKKNYNTRNKNFANNSKLFLKLFLKLARYRGNSFADMNYLK